MSPAKAASAVRFEATLYAIDGSTIFRLPEKASNQLPSRGQVAVQAAVNGRACQIVAEPDASPATGCGSTRGNSGPLRVGDTAEAGLVPLEDWPEPKVPRDLQAALAAAPDKIEELWKDITPMARWEWVRWVNATRNPGTRQPRRGQHLEDAERAAPAVLFQPGRVHRPGPFEEREADQAAMIRLSYAVSEPCGPWGVSQR